MDKEFDMEAGVEDIANSLNLAPVEEVVAEVEITPEAPVEAAVEAPVTVRAAPQSWAKETHELWTKLDPKVQDQIERREKQMLEGLGQYKEHNEFGRQMREIFTPYKDILQQQGIDEAKAAQYLLNAHSRLLQLPAEQKFSYLAQIAQNYGINLGQPQGQQQADPEVLAIKQTLNQLVAAQTQQQQKAYEDKRTQVSNEVTSFADAKDEKGEAKHPYFDEVADDIVPFLHAGHSLEDAYKKAVWANPVTREKELARIRTDAEANLRQRSKAEAEKAKQASSANVRSRDTRKAPTEPLGKMEDTLKATLTDIQSRTH